MFETRSHPDHGSRVSSAPSSGCGVAGLPHREVKEGFSLNTSRIFCLHTQTFCVLVCR